MIEATQDSVFPARSLPVTVTAHGSAPASDSLNYVISPQQSLSKPYRQAMASEMAVWEYMDLESLRERRIDHPEILAYRGRILGKVDGATDYVSWASFLLREHGSRERCLSLGSGLGRMEKFLINTGFTSKFETIELSPHGNKKARIYEEGIEALEGDLNFVQLERESYDFILCHGVLHHLINLEHVFGQLNRALKPNGLLLVYEYVGPNRWQFPDATLAALRDLFPTVAFKRPLLWDVPGFESVRSADLLPLIEAQCGSAMIQAVSYGGVYFPFITCTDPSADIHMCRVIELDAQGSCDDRLPPCFFVGLFGKSRCAPVQATPWLDSELQTRLYPPAPVVTGIKRYLRGSKAGPALRSLKRFATKSF
jgi:SAM-dependent methyltransferase